MVALLNMNNPFFSLKLSCQRHGEYMSKRIANKIYRDLVKTGFWFVFVDGKIVTREYCLKIINQEG